MNEIVLKENDIIRITHMDELTTNISFYHVDRVASMNVMIYVHTGTIYVTENDIDYAVNAGEMLFLKKGTHQYGKRLIMEGTSWLYAHFQIDQAVGADEYDMVNEQSSIMLPKHMKLYDYTDARRCLKELCSTYSSEKSMSGKRASLGLQSLFLDLTELMNAQNTNGLAVNIDSFIKKNLRKELRSEDLVSEFHVTYKYLNKVYKKEYGRSIMQAHFAERMKLASVELRTGNQPVNCVGEELGFSDPLYFSKCFKKFAGVSPRKYRQISIQNF